MIYCFYFAVFWIKKLNKEETSLTENRLRLYKCLAISDNQGAFSIFSDINELSSASINLLNNEISNLLSQNRRLDEELKKSSIDSLELYAKLENIKSDLNKYKGYKLVKIAFFIAKRIHKLKIKLRNF